MYQVIGGAGNRGFRVIWMLEELGQPYELINVKPHSPEALAANPGGKLPALGVDGAYLSDSAAILTYLADKHQALTYPAGSLQRGQQDGMMQLVLDELDALLWMAARHSFILPEERRVTAVKDSLKWEFQRNTDHLAARLPGPFIAGDQMTIADIVLTHCLGWAQVARFPKPEPRLLDYSKRMRGRPAYQRAAQQR